MWPPPRVIRALAVPATFEVPRRARCVPLFPPPPLPPPDDEQLPRVSPAGAPPHGCFWAYPSAASCHQVILHEPEYPTPQYVSTHLPARTHPTARARTRPPAPARARPPEYVVAHRRMPPLARFLFYACTRPPCPLACPIVRVLFCVGIPTPPGALSPRACAGATKLPSVSPRPACIVPLLSVFCFFFALFVLPAYFWQWLTLRPITAGGGRCVFLIRGDAVAVLLSTLMCRYRRKLVTFGVASCVAGSTQLRVNRMLKCLLVTLFCGCMSRPYLFLSLFDVHCVPSTACHRFLCRCFLCCLLLHFFFSFFGDYCTQFSPMITWDSAEQAAFQRVRQCCAIFPRKCQRAFSYSSMTPFLCAHRVLHRLLSRIEQSTLPFA